MAALELINTDLFDKIQVFIGKSKNGMGKY
jgi:hypothetical protein